jgi:hypothetical protein
MDKEKIPRPPLSPKDVDRQIEAIEGEFKKISLRDDIDLDDKYLLCKKLRKDKDDVLGYDSLLSLRYGKDFPSFYTATTLSVDHIKRPTMPNPKMAPVYRYTEITKENEEGETIPLDVAAESPATITAESLSLDGGKKTDTLLSVINDNFTGTDQEILQEFVGRNKYHGIQKELATKYKLSKGEISKTIAKFIKIASKTLT